MSSYGDRAEELFRSGYNCAQAVLMAFADVTHLDDIMAAKLASPFGGGMGQLREACGAFSGALLVMGADDGSADPRDHEARRRVYADVRAYAEKFRDAHGSIVCGELLGVRPSGGNAAERPRKQPCSALVHTAADLLADTLGLS